METRLTTMIRTLFSLIALTSPLLAGGLLPSQIPASAKWVFHVDMAAIRDSATGRAILGHVEAEHGDQLRAASRMFGFHPVQDMHGVSLHGDGTKDHGVAIFHGKFDREHLEDIVRAAEGYSSSRHGDHTVHSWRDKGSIQHAAFIGADLLVVSRQKNLLEANLDVTDGKAPASEDPLFTAEQPAGSLGIAAARLSGMALPADAAKMIRKMDSLRLAAAEIDGRFNIEAQAQTREAADADRMRRFLDGLLALAQLDETLLDGIDLRAQMVADPGNRTLSASLGLPVEELLGMLRSLAERRQR
jgi:hypothetical protein